jgi:hypothetical protein
MNESFQEKLLIGRSGDCAIEKQEWRHFASAATIARRPNH